MFLSVKERARQIANGQFTAPTTSAPTASLIDLAPEVKHAPPKKAAAKEAPVKAAASPSKTKLSKPAPKEPAPPAAPPAVPKTTSTPVPPEAPTPKKASKSKLTKDPSKPSSPKIGSSKSSSSKAPPTPKAPSTPKLPSQPKPSSTPSSKRSHSPPKPSSTSKPKRSTSPPQRSKSPPKRADSPLESPPTTLSTLQAACLKQISGVTGLRSRPLAVLPKQRSSGAWYAALQDTSSGRYLTVWTNRDKTFESAEEALSAYLVFATRARNEVRWFPARGSSPKAKGRAG